MISTIFLTKYQQHWVMKRGLRNQRHQTLGWIVTFLQPVVEKMARQGWRRSSLTLSAAEDTWTLCLHIKSSFDYEYLILRRDTGVVLGNVICAKLCYKILKLSFACVSSLFPLLRIDRLASRVRLCVNCLQGEGLTKERMTGIRIRLWNKPSTITRENTIDIKF